MTVVTPNQAKSQTIRAKRKDLMLHRWTKSDQSLREKFSLSLFGPVSLCHKYPALHHSPCQLLSSELDYIKFCYWKIFGAASPREVRTIVTRFLHVCKIPACEHRLSVPFCDSRESGLMLVLLLCSGHMFLYSACATSETRHSCPGRKYTLRYDNDHNLYFRGWAPKYTDGH